MCGPEGPEAKPLSGKSFLRAPTTVLSLNHAKETHPNMVNTNFHEVAASG